MGGIRSYATAIFGTALIISIVTDLSENSAFKKQIRLICSIILTMAILKPLLSFSSVSINEFIGSDWMDANAAAEIGKTFQSHSIQNIIRDETAAYIQKEAKALGADIIVKVELNADSPPFPVAVTISGFFDKACKDQLCTLLVQQFDIPKEQQTWISLDQNNSGIS